MTEEKPETTEEETTTEESNYGDDPDYEVGEVGEEDEECDDLEEYSEYDEKVDEDLCDEEYGEDCDNDVPSGGFFNKYDEPSIYLILNPHSNGNRAPNRSFQQKTSRHSKSYKPQKTIKKKVYDFYNKYNCHERKYFDNLTKDEKDHIENIENQLITINNNNIEPIRFKFLKLNIPDRTKKIIISKIDNLNHMSSSSNGEYYKLHNWMNILNEIPFGKYYEIPIKNTDGNNNICSFLENIRQNMNTTIYGHKEAKEQIIRILAQLISFPRANGYIIGIQGNAGVGKTKLIKEGICNALNYPYAFISLGGTDDASYLRGHSYTYEGATYGKICESLIKAGIMNPLILFDELDKVSNTYRGQEIINTLIHVTDPVQNDKYNDRYFEEIDLDISRSMIVFTFNDESQINPILRDRMIVINVPGYNQNEKLVLAQDYLIPEILKQYNISYDDILFTNDVLRYIIENTEKEEGVRNLKRAINNIVSWINMMRYVSIDNIKISFPFEVTIKYYETYCKSSKNTISKDILHAMYV